MGKMAELNVNGVNSSRAVPNVGGPLDKQVNNNNRQSSGYFEDMMQSQRENKPQVFNNTDNINPDADNFRINAADTNETAAQIKTIPVDILHRALADAEIEVTQYTMDIVKSLINGSLPLTEKNITDLLLLSHMFKDVPLNVLTIMMKLEIPVTQENVRQFESIIIAQEKLSEKIESLINKMTGELAAGSRNLSELSSAMAKLLEIAAASEYKSGSNIDGNGGVNNAGISNVGNEINIINGKPVFDRAEMNNLLNMLRDLKAPESMLHLIMNINRGNVKNTGIAGNTVDSMLNVINRFVQAMNADGIKMQNSTSAKTANNNIILQNQNNQNNQSIQESRQIFNKTKILFESPEFQKLLKSAIEDKLLISPKNISRGQIENFYNGLNKNLSDLIRMFSNNSIKNANQTEFINNERNSMSQFQYNFQSDAKAIKENLSFMNELNKTMPFLQIPIKFTDKIINSDLYIFKNKKKKEKNGENTENGAKSLNALIKLELKNLGGLDIYINMAGKNIRSKFFADNQTAIDEIEKNLPELNSTMHKMGFNFISSASVSESEKNFDFIEDFINRETPRTEVKNYLFKRKI